MPHLRQQKMDLRYAMELKRASAMSHNPEAPLKLRDNFLKAIEIPPGAVIAGYCTKGSEIDPAPLIDSLRIRGHKIALPVVVNKGMPLKFQLHQSGDELVTNPMGISEPKATAPIMDPDIFLVPLLAFDQRGYRLGYGGGYYDRTLYLFSQRKKILSIGLSFSCQEIAEVPIDHHDIKLDKIVTESCVY
jgi:5-formyltetrahydrofolate cyclo-ligase